MGARENKQRIAAITLKTLPPLSSPSIKKQKDNKHRTVEHKSLLVFSGEEKKHQNHVHLLWKKDCLSGSVGAHMTDKS